MSISSRIESIEGHIGDIYDTLELGGSDLTNVDKNIDNISGQLIDRYKDYLANGTGSIWNNWDKATETGVNEATINNTIQAKMKMDLKGNTEQATRSGKNVFNENYYNNVELYTNGNLYFAYVELPDNFKTTFYGNMFLKGISQGLVLGFSDQNNSVSNRILNNGSLNANVSYNFTNSEHVYLVIGNSNRINISTDIPLIFENYNIMVTTNTDTTYEPYGAMPSPEYPSPVNTITGDVEVKVQNKNQAWNGWAEDFVSRMNDNTKAKIETKDNKSCLFFSASAGYQDYDIKYLFKTSWKKNTAYTIDFDVYTSVYTSSSDANMTIEYTDGTLTRITGTQAGIWTHLNITSTSSKTIKYIRPFYSSGITYIDLDTFMVVEGTSAGEYTPHQEQNYPISLGESLPDNFTKVEYIESTGTQYIDTGVVGNQDTKIDIDFAFTDNSGSWAAVFGGRESSSDGKWIAIHQASQQRNIRADFGLNATFLYTDLVYNDYNKHNFVLEDYKLYIDGEYIGNFGTSTNFSTSTTMAVFCNKYGTSTAEFSTAKVYSLKIYDGSTLVRNFIPCYRNSDNEIGLYDLVNNQFYTNKGTGTFKKGKSLTNGIELRKIGDYQDYIYKENGNWYKYGAIGKVVLDGSEDESYSGNSNLDTTDYKCYYITNSDCIMAPNTTNVFVYCDKLLGTGSVDRTKNELNCWLNHFVANNLMFHVPNTVINLEGLRTWLTTNNLMFYYPLAIPTKTPITDTTLINQLNAFEEAYSYNEQTNISQDGDLPFILDVTALIELS